MCTSAAKSNDVWNVYWKCTILSGRKKKKRAISNMKKTHSVWQGGLWCNLWIGLEARILARPHTGTRITSEMRPHIWQSLTSLASIIENKTIHDEPSGTWIDNRIYYKWAQLPVSKGKNRVLNACKRYFCYSFILGSVLYLACLQKSLREELSPLGSLRKMTQGGSVLNQSWNCQALGGRK